MLQMVSVNFSYLVRCIYKLHAFVSDRQNNSWDFSHLFCGSLEKRQAQAFKHTKLIYYWLIVHIHFFIASRCWKDYYTPAFWHKHLAWIQYPSDL